MANHRNKRVGEALGRIAIQSMELAEYIVNEKKNEGHIALGTIKEMSNVIVSNVKLLEQIAIKENEKEKEA